MNKWRRANWKRMVPFCIWEICTGKVQGNAWKVSGGISNQNHCYPPWFFGCLFVCFFNLTCRGTGLWGGLALYQTFSISWETVSNCCWVFSPSFDYFCQTLKGRSWELKELSAKPDQTGVGSSEEKRPESSWRCPRNQILGSEMCEKTSSGLLTISADRCALFV